MAIAKIKKIEIIGLNQDKERLLGLLHKLGKVQLIASGPEGSVGGVPISYADADILEVAEAVAFLDTYKEKSGPFSSFLNFKPVVYERQMQDIIAGCDYRNILEELRKLRSHLKHISQHKDKLLQEKQLLLPWKDLRLSLEELHYQQHCGITLGVLDNRAYQELSADLKQYTFNLYLETVHQDKVNRYLAIFYLRQDLEALEGVLKKLHFNFVTLPRHQCTPGDRLFEINREFLTLDDQAEEAREKIALFYKEQFSLKVVHDYLANQERIRQADHQLARQQFTFRLSAWIREKEVASFREEIAARFKDVAFFVSEPPDNEEVPIILENKGLIQPFEFITSIYGMPQYRELDPTPFLAPFFFLYFGFCVSDVGYGLILIILSWLILKKIKLGPQGQKFFKLFLFCGISTVIVGALTGSWFGNLLELTAEANAALLPLKKFKDALVVLDPLRQPTKLLGIALSLGIIQVWFGNIVSAIGNIKNKRYWDILFDQITMFFLLFGLTGIGLVFLKIISAQGSAIFKYAVLGGSLGLILTQGRSEKGLGGKLFYGIYYLYNNLSGYLSDILSYSRLWALGLVTGVMANTINLISVQFSQILVSLIPFVGKIIFLRIIISGIILAVIFVLGHLVAFLMNLLGAFVHPLRLQFVEFFSKFFKSGGSLFRPFRIQTKYIDIS
jgi:V/A-type H+-transporting ATPase subunit I